LTVPDAMREDLHSGSDSAAVATRATLIAAAWAAVWVVAFAAAFYTTPWFMVAADALTETSRFGWPETLRNAFAPDIEYRPLFRLANKAAFQLFGFHIWAYETLVLAQFATVLGLVIWFCRPTTLRRALATCIALGCLAGLHTSRILFGFLLVNMGSVALILLLVAIAMAIEPRARAFGWVLGPLVLVSMLSVEWGVMVALVLPVLWLTGAPGLDRRAMTWAMAGLAAYVAIRFVFGLIAAPPPFHTESGFGFAQLSPEQLQARFERAPWLFGLYNVMSTFLTVVASEPRSGVFSFVQSFIEGNVPYWQWLHVVSSLLTTTAVAAALMLYRPSSGRDRFLSVAGLTLLVAGSGFGLPYTRDRMGMMAGVGYSLLVYVAVAAMLEQPAHGWRRRAMVCSVVIVASAWMLRSVETFFQLRDTAWEYHREWIERAAELDVMNPPDPILTTMRAAVLSGAPGDPRLDPTWTYVPFERRFPINAARPLSPPFDLRWAPDVSDAERRRLEEQLGLIGGEPVSRDSRHRTWTYRLHRPTRGRVKAILTNADVEDTARIDAERLEIVE